MGKAFTDKERAEIKEKLRRSGLEVLKETGIKNISIRDVTKKAGIAQGGFYTFYGDKDEFVLDLMSLRVREKTDIMYENRAKTLTDPRGFLVELFYKEGMHLKENKAFNNSDGATLSFWDRIAKSGNDKIGEGYASFLSKMIAFWEEEGYAVKCDEKGLISAGLAAGILFSNSHMMPSEYFEAIYRAFCEAEVDRFFSARKKK
ncbi:transcriptional regulator, TetR family [Lachnospiraceae bacterium YSD2013]|nr:transcriptional regulator, TetR family [Lachnospiraceae bacterium YSD2013]